MAAAAIIDGRRIFMVRSNPRKRFLFDGALKVEEACMLIRELVEALAVGTN